MSAGAGDPAGLRALTVDVTSAPPVDPYAAAGADGVVFASPARALSGWGVAAVLPLPRGLEDAGALRSAVDWLAAVGSDDRVGSPVGGVVAFATLPFDRGRPGALVVPRLLHGAHGAARWATLVGGRHEVDAADEGSVRRALARAAATTGPAGAAATGEAGTATPYPLHPRPAPPDHEKAVAAALEAIEAGLLDKVVLSRFLDVAAVPPLSPSAMVRRLHEQEPSCTAFALPVDGGLFLGASPELLVRRRGPRVTSQPLAGTAALTGSATEDDRVAAALLASRKDQREHRLVVEAIARELGPRCAELTVPAHPSIVHLRSVVHLLSTIEGTLAGGAGWPSALELVAALHPTPAVGGVPRAEALATIERLEVANRGHWAGAVGWVSANGDGEWVIGLRSATVGGHGATLCAGGGIVAGSDPAAELHETTVKLRPVLEALYPGAGRQLSGAPPTPPPTA